MVGAVGGYTPSGVLPHLERRLASPRAADDFDGGGRWWIHPERRLASPRAASCLTSSGVLPHLERRTTLMVGAVGGYTSSGGRL
jgi:hypothetical protein